ncbi:hypothetical protein Ancab_018219 [Ancistrocladus abbreviatus]
MEFIRSNEKERLKVNEMLMALLIRLDSICAVDVAIRDCRKAVIQRTIMLQGRVDSIVVAVDQVEDSDNMREGDEGVVSEDGRWMSFNREKVRFHNWRDSEAVGEDDDKASEIWKSGRGCS